MQTTKNTQTQEIKNESASNTMQDAKAFGCGLFNKLRQRLHGMKFWLMALICLAFRCFVLYPFGQLCALVIGTVWCYENWTTVRRFFQSIGGKAAGVAREVSSDSTSLWYEQEGEKLIENLISTLSRKNISYCNLAEQIKLPPESHWHAISVALNKKGIRTQVSRDAFFIAWNLTGAQVQ